VSALAPPLLPSSNFGPGARPSLLSFGSTPGSLLASVGEAAGVKDFSVGVPMSSAEAVEAGLTAVEIAASSASVDFSSCASSFSSSKSLGMMTLPSPGGLRKSWLS
jgi:hypothetical protein